MRCATGLAAARVWAIEDCRHLCRRLERDLIAADEQMVRVPPKLMVIARDSTRTFGKSDPIDALAVARAALREPDLPVARLHGADRKIRLMVDNREDLVAERTRIIGRLRWHQLFPPCRPCRVWGRHSYAARRADMLIHRAVARLPRGWHGGARTSPVSLHVEPTRAGSGNRGGAWCGMLRLKYEEAVMDFFS